MGNRGGKPLEPFAMDDESGALSGNGPNKSMGQLTGAWKRLNSLDMVELQPPKVSPY